MSERKSTNLVRKIFSLAVAGFMLFGVNPAPQQAVAEEVNDPDNGLSRFIFGSASNASEGESLFYCDDFTVLRPDDGTDPSTLQDFDESAAYCLTRDEAIQYQTDGTLPSGLTEADLIDPQDSDPASDTIAYQAQLTLDVSNNRTLEDFTISTLIDELGPNVMNNRFFVQYELDGQEQLYEDDAGTLFQNEGSQSYFPETTLIRVYNFETQTYENLISGTEGENSEGQSLLFALVTEDGNPIASGAFPGGINLGNIDSSFNSDQTDSPYVGEDGIIFMNVFYFMQENILENPTERLLLDKRGLNTNQLPQDYGFNDFSDSNTSVSANETVKYSVFMHENGWNSTLNNYTLTDEITLGEVAGQTLQNTITADYEKIAGTPGNYTTQQFSTSDSFQVNVNGTNLIARYVPNSTRVYDREYNPVSLPQLGGSNVIPDVTVDGEVVSALMDPNGYLYNLDPYNAEANYLQGCYEFIRHIEYEVEFVNVQEPETEVTIDKYVQELDENGDTVGDTAGEGITTGDERGTLVLPDGDTADVRYYITLENTGDTAVTNIAHTDTYQSLSNGGTLSNITNVQPSGVQVTGDPASGSFNILVPLTLNPGDTATVSFDATVNRGSVETNEIRNNISIDSIDGEILDPKPSDFVDVIIGETPEDNQIYKEVSLTDGTGYGPDATLTDEEGTAYYRVTIENNGDTEETFTFADTLFGASRQIIDADATVTLLSGVDSTTPCAGSSNISDCVVLTGGTLTNTQSTTELSFTVPAESTATVRYAASVVNTGDQIVEDIENVITPTEGVVCPPGGNIGTPEDAQDCDAYITVPGEQVQINEIPIYKEVALEGTGSFEDLNFGPSVTLPDSDGRVVYRATITNPTGVSQPVTLSDTLWDHQSVDFTSNIRRLVKGDASVTLLDWDNRSSDTLCTQEFMSNCVEIVGGTLNSTTFQNVDVMVPPNSSTEIYYAGYVENLGNSTVNDIENEIFPVAANGNPEVTVVCPPDGDLGTAGDDQDCDAFVSVPPSEENPQIVKEVSGEENGTYVKSYDTTENPDYAWYRITITNPTSQDVTTTVSDDLWEGPISSNGAQVEFVARDSDDAGSVSADDIRIEGDTGTPTFDDTAKEVEVTVPSNGSVEIYYRGKISTTVQAMRKMVNTVTNEFCPPNNDNQIDDCEAEVCINTEEPSEPEVIKQVRTSQSNNQFVNSAGAEDGEVVEYRITVDNTQTDSENTMVTLTDTFWEVVGNLRQADPSNLPNGVTGILQTADGTDSCPVTVGALGNCLTVSPGKSLIVTGDDAGISFMVDADEVVTITYQVLVTNSTSSVQTIDNVVVPTNAVCPPTEPDCDAEVEIQPPESEPPVVFKQVQTSTTNGFANEGEADDGEVVQYRLTVDNTQQNAQDTTVTLSDIFWEVSGGLRQANPSDLTPGVTAVLMTSDGTTVCGTTMTDLENCLIPDPSTTGLTVLNSNEGISLDIDANETVTITYNVRVTNTTENQITIQNIVTPGGAVCPPEEPDCDAIVEIIPEPPEYDIQKRVENVTRTYTGDTNTRVSALPGDEIQFTVIARQTAGPVPQTVTVTDVVDERFEIIESSISNNGSYNAGNRTITWNNIEFTSLNTDVVLTFNVTTDLGLPKGTVIPNVAVLETGKDTTPNIDSNIVEVEIVGPELSIDKSVVNGKEFYQPGENVTYRITVTNIDNQPATNVVVSDTIPAGVTYQSANPEPASIEGQLLTWNVGRLEPGQSVILEVTVNINIGLPNSTLENVATVNYTDENETPQPEKEDRETVVTRLFDSGTEILLAALISLMVAGSVTGVVYATKRRRKKQQADIVE